jgi:hypothetical protein
VNGRPPSLLYHPLVIRTQIEWTEEQAAALREIAAREGRSIEEVIRESVDAYASSRQSHAPGRRDAAAAVAGRFRSGLADLGLRHDEHLAEETRK